MSVTYLMHYGVGHFDDPPGRGSGRFEYGTGDNPNQHVRDKSLSEQEKALKAKGLSGREVAIRLGFENTTKLREAITREAEANKHAKDTAVRELLKTTTSSTEIGRRLGLPESTVRAIISNLGEETRLEKTERIKNEIKELVKQDKFIDIGTGAEVALGISETKKKQIISELKQEGYTTHEIKIEQQGTKFKTTLLVLCDENMTKKDVYDNKYNIKPVDRFIVNEDGTRSVLGLPKVNSVDSDRVLIRYAEDGGIDKDGVIELRRGVADISLGNAIYAQVRIGVDDKHYLKGMAVYGDDSEFPSGKDIIFNTNKAIGTPQEKVFKPMEKVKDTGEIDWDNPFGASIKREDELKFAQRYYTDPDSGERKVSAINVVNEQGDWGNWKKTLSSQFLSKQPTPLIKQQLNLAYLQKEDEYEDIMSIKNDSVRKVMLENFADKCSSAAVDLKAAALPRQQSHVILPLTTIKDNEIYAPNYIHGEEVILIRHPHAGPFEIPKCTVNNKNKEAISILGKNPIDAVGISGKTAAQLSGADFDGDSVIVIPIRKGKDGTIPVRVDKAIKKLQEFDPKSAYPAYEGMKEVKSDSSWNRQREMGNVSNLITDMTLAGADTTDIIKAVRHSMVVIDAEKHNLNWRQSEIDNGIKLLKTKYQGGPNRGASTIISKASSQANIEQEGFRFKIDENGNKINFPTGQMQKERKPTNEHDEYGRRIYKDTGRMVPVTQKSTKMAETNDAYTLLSGYAKVKNRIKDPENLTAEDKKLIAANSHDKEIPYAEYANSMKDLSRKAWSEWKKTPTAKKDVNASKTYAKEVKELDEMAANLTKNAPREHQAQLRAGENYYKKKAERNDRDKDELKKLRNQCLAEARLACGAESIKVNLTPKQWEAIENHAISGTKVEKLIKKTDTKTVLSYAIPKEGASLSTSKIARIRAMAGTGETTEDIAAQLNISTSTVQKYLNQGA